jgi:CBS-domain-containing membrane protein
MPEGADPEIMSADVTCVAENESLADAAGKMADLDVGALPIRGDDNRLKGILTDRDIVEGAGSGTGPRRGDCRGSADLSEGNRSRSGRMTT